MGEDGFEPSKHEATDLQSAPFGHSGILPYSIENGAGRRTRTPDLLITNQLLYQLSYTSTFWWEKMDSNHRSTKQQIYSLPPLATREFSHIELSRMELVDGLEPPTC